MKVTGTGNITPFSIGKHDFVSFITKERSQIVCHKSFEDIKGVSVNFINEKVLAQCWDQREIRRVAGISRYAISAVKLAIEDSINKNINSKETALIVALTHGALNYTCQYHRSIVESNSVDISPLLFSESVLNAPAGNVSIYFGINGPVHTIVGGNTAGLKAIGLATQILSTNRYRRVIVVASEEINHLSLFCHAKLGEKIFSEAAVAVIIDNNESASNAYCKITSSAHFHIPNEPEKALKIAVNRALRKADLELSDIEMVLTNSASAFSDTETIDMRNFFGNCFSVSSLLNMLLGVLLFKESALKDAFKVSNVENIMICDVEKTGESSVVILSLSE